MPEGGAKQEVLRSLPWQQLAQQSPSTLAQYVISLPAGTVPDHLPSTIVGEWAQTDLNSTVAWVEQLPKGHAKQEAIGDQVHNQPSRSSPVR